MHFFWIILQVMKGVIAKFLIWTGPQFCPKISQKSEIKMYDKKPVNFSIQEILTKRNVSLFSSFRGSITVETALVLPLFFFFCIQFLSVLCLFGLHSVLTAALHQEVLELSLQAYTCEQAGIDTESMLLHVLGEAYLKKKIIEYAGEEYLDASMIEGGKGGIRIQFEKQQEKGQDVVDVTLSYRIRPYFGIMGFQDFSMSNRCQVKAWTGYVQPVEDRDGSNEDELVYITENGSVYHKSRQCSYLNLSIQEVNTSQLEMLRNADGGKYYACERCRGGKQEIVFLTEDGTRYHTSLMCSGLKRTIYVVRRSEAGGRSACSRCGGTF